MATLAGDLDREGIAGGHHGAAPDGETADRQSRPVVHAVDAGDIEAFQQPVLKHQLATAAQFLARLKYDGNPSTERARGAQMPGRAQQHRRVPIVSAGMHFARYARGISGTRFLEDGKGIHIGAQAECRAIAQAPGDGPNDARAANPGCHFVAAEFPQLLRHKGCRRMGVEVKFRIGVQFAPPTRDLRLKFDGAIEKRHGCS